MIECVLDISAFRKHVLLPLANPGGQAPKKPLMSRELQDELKRLRYIRKASESPMAFGRLFAVPRPDGKSRLIWDGRHLNANCQKPPQFHLKSIPEHITYLLRDEIALFLVADMKTWFVQLKPCRDVAQYFGVWLYDGEYILNGLLMGWSWAPVIAQFSSEGVAGRIMSKIVLAMQKILAMVYIDNLIFAIPRSCLSYAASLKRILIEEASTCGAIIKDGSIEMGQRVDWLGVTLDASSHTFSISQKFITKFPASLALNQDLARPMPIRSWYSIISWCS